MTDETRHRLSIGSVASWLPPRGHAVPWRALRPRSRLHWVSCGLLWAILAVYAATWIGAHDGYLFDPRLQNDDARTSLFPFHRYGPEATLTDDPIANDVLVRLPPVTWLSYRVLTPLVGLHAASKVMQLVCLAIVGLAAGVLVRGRRGGLACGLLLVFFMLHTPFVVNRIGGGHPRGFAFPLMALWIAGVTTGSHRWRFGAVVATALTYAPAMLILLTAEGMFMLAGLRASRRHVLVGRIKRLALLSAVCAACLTPHTIATMRYGPTHTLEQARQDPVFVHSPRRVLPFEPPVTVGTRYLGHPFRANGSGPVAPLLESYDRLGVVGSLLVIAGLAGVVIARRAPLPAAALALLAAAALAYIAARLLAFRLYSPARYLSYGTVAASVALVVSVVGMLWPTLRPRRLRAIRRNFAAVAAITLSWLVTGDGMIRPGTRARDGAVNHNGMSIDERQHAPLYAFIRTLPADSRIALHPRDGAGITYWTGRATTEHLETLTPWWVEPWRRARARTEDTLRALYAVDPRELMAYCDRYSVTHLLIHAGRYTPAFREHARVFPPFDELVDGLPADLRLEQLAVLDLPPAAVVYRNPPWVILDIDRARIVTAASAKDLSHEP